MMKIQIITNGKYSIGGCTISRLDSVDTFDSYDINVIDLGCESIWKYRGSSTRQTNEYQNLLSIAQMKRGAKKARFLYVLPKNLTFFSDYYDSRYCASVPLRDNIQGLLEILSSAMTVRFGLGYEPNKVMIEEKEVRSDFYFEDISVRFAKAVRSCDSEKIVAFAAENGDLITTLDILNGNVLLPFLNLFTGEREKEYPSWFNGIAFFDDADLLKTIEENKKTIDSAESAIKNAEKAIEKNEYYKTLLVETGDALVEVVFSVLKELLSVDLSRFVDKKKEDFSFELKGLHFVGEIKGVNENVKNKHLSELENNKQEYIDENNLENAKGLLIINHQRQTAPSERVPVNEQQIQYAKKHDLLIIESTTLLSIFEKRLEGCLDSEKLFDVLANQSGLLKDEWK